jgi:integrase
MERMIKMFYRKRGNKWYYGFSITDEHGKRKQVERVGGRTRQEAQVAARKALQSSLDAYGQWREPEKMSFRDYWALYLREYAEMQLRPATIRTYQCQADKHILPALGNLELYKFTPRLLQNFINGLQGQLSRSSLQTLSFVLKSAFTYATDTCKFLPSTPASSLSAPRDATAPKVAHVFSIEQIRQIFNQFPSGHKMHMPIALAYYTGMRLGECLSLVWNDVDFDSLELRIHSTMYDQNGNGTVQDVPKTSSSIRNVPIGNKLLYELKAMHKYQLEQRFAYGPLWKGTDFVCCREDGHFMISDDMRWFGQWCRKNFGGGSFHSLRHTHATMLLEAGEDLELVSKRLGHSSINTTAKVYSHVLDGRMDKSRRLLNEVL